MFITNINELLLSSINNNLENNLQYLGISELCENIKYISNLKRLDVSCIIKIILDNDIGSDGVERIYNKLKYLPELSSLNVNANDYRNSGIIIIQKLKKEYPKISCEIDESYHYRRKKYYNSDYTDSDDYESDYYDY